MYLCVLLPFRGEVEEAANPNTRNKSQLNEILRYFGTG
jgi:hypothetical protein